jgi:hypothetical protein
MICCSSHGQINPPVNECVKSGSLVADRLPERVKIRIVKAGKAVLLQAWSGLEDSRKLRFPDYMTTAHYGRKVISLTHWPPLPPGNAPGTHFC